MLWLYFKNSFPGPLSDCYITIDEVMIYDYHENTDSLGHYTLSIIAVKALGHRTLALDGHLAPGPLQDLLEYSTKTDFEVYIPFLRCRSFGLKCFCT